MIAKVCIEKPPQYPPKPNVLAHALKVSPGEQKVLHDKQKVQGLNEAIAQVLEKLCVLNSFRPDSGLRLGSRYR